MNRFPVPHSVKRFAVPFTESGYSLYIVGGAVRDHLLGRPTNDYDFATDAAPQQVMRLFRNVIPTGIQHGTVTVLFKGASYEVTTFRTDGAYKDNRHPDQVTFVRSLDEDLRRRDFTINALAVDVSNGQLVDRHGGLQDIADRKIRAIGIPLQRFHEDALRIIRACRFASQLGFDIDGETMAAMADVSGNLTSVSGERIRAELFKILESEHPSAGLLAMLRCGALRVVIPELTDGEHVTQKGNHVHDVLMHQIASCEAAPQSKPLVRLAALLHDVGKPESKGVGIDGEATFHQHEYISERMAKQVLDRLKCANEEKSQVLNLIRNHMFHYTEDWSDGAVRRFVNRVGIEAIPDLFDLRRADRFAINGETHYDDLVVFARRIEQVLAASSALTVKDLTVDGHDLAELGIPKGPKMGMVLRMLLETVLDDPAQNERETLKVIAKRFYEQRIDIG